MQVLAMLGCVEEKRILELGAGIGRFTGPLAVTARSVLAIDFMEHLIEENKRANSHRWALLDSFYCISVPCSAPAALRSVLAQLTWIAYGHTWACLYSA